MPVSPQSPRLLPWPEVNRLVPYTRQHLSRLERAGRFPRRLRLAGTRVAWIEAEITAWIEARAAERPDIFEESKRLHDLEGTENASLNSQSFVRAGLSGQP